MRPLDPTRLQHLYQSGAERGLGTVRADLARLQEQLTTGLRVNRPSDDPAAFAQARALESLERQHAAYARSIDGARLWTDRTQEELDRLGELFVRAQELGLQGATATTSAEDRAVLAGRVDELLAEALDAMNARVGNDYLFGGARTTTAPFAADGTATGDLSGALKRRIGPDTEIAINIPGARLLDTGAGFTLPEALAGLAAALRGESEEPLADALGRVETARDHVVRLGSAAGATASRLSEAAFRLDDARTTLAQRRSTVEDTDFLEATLHLQQRQIALEAALRTTASVSQLSLLDFLR